MALCVSAGGCSKHQKQAPDDFTVVRLWHAYNAYAKDVFDSKVAEFNETKGAEQGIVVEASGYGSSEELYYALRESAGKIIGSEPLPDLFSAYPDNACELDSMAPLAELDQYFTEEELKEYRPEFLKEGIWEQGASPKMIPISKSTELLFVNWTDFKQFSKSTGITEECFQTWEGLLKASEDYNKWSGGKSFLGINRESDFAVLTAAQMGEIPYELADGASRWNYSAETAKRVWEVFYVPHMKGLYKSKVYNQDGIKSGELLAYVGSSAGVSYFPKEVIVNEGKSYPIECRVFPFPVMAGGAPYLTQRGANMAIFASEPSRERAAASFLKWFTSSEENLDFALSTGYLPVKTEAFGLLLERLPAMPMEDATEKSLQAAFLGMERGDFYSRTTYPGSFGLSRLFRESLPDKTELDLEEMAARMDRGEKQDALLREYLSDENFNNWYESFKTKANEELK